MSRRPSQGPEPEDVDAWAERVAAQAPPLSKKRKAELRAIFTGRPPNEAANDPHRGAA